MALVNVFFTLVDVFEITIEESNENVVEVLNWTVVVWI